ncbi:DeoR/GlpR family DNA-binding transcription regulator [Xanthobacter autotrophicus]|uniref:DeoR/GlpR family DNA-binding transcription regulator n=1 Tax=Xanthobacter TaxID=279 RepID=UPI0024ABBDE1|nr:DeoR/GlpR family DNA-binding transcription regulator [Xanthobacter autotrophicus]MDI4664944.1 DeoR/GlpR family DNA-binding transcription regulator [Xanthobacter autotrophicus]
MAQTVRQQQIVDLLRDRRSLTIADLAGHFQVSDETIRRDLKALAEAGMVDKFHGGVRLNVADWEAPFDRRLREQAGAKRRIALAAAELIEEDATILLDNSSTSCFLAQVLAPRAGRLTAITFSVEVAQILSSAGRHHRVILPGGELRADDRTIIGPSAIDFASQFTPSLFVMSVAAASPTRGCMDFDLFETEFKRAMIPLADKVMLLLDSSKYTKPGLIQVCDWPSVDILVTEDGPPAAIRTALEHARIVLAPAIAETGDGHGRRPAYAE